MDQEQVVNQVEKLVSSIEQFQAPQLILSQLDQLHKKTDKLSDQNLEIIKNQAVANYQLELHMKRTAQMEEAFKPIQKHVTQVDGAARLVGLIATIVAIMAGLFKVFGS